MLGLLLVVLAHRAGKEHEPGETEKAILRSTEHWLGVFMPFYLLVAAIICIIVALGHNAP